MYFRNNDNFLQCFKTYCEVISHFSLQCKCICTCIKIWAPTHHYLNTQLKLYWLRNMAIRARNNLVIWILKLSDNSFHSGFVLYNAMSWKRAMNFGENPSFHHLHKKRAFNYSCSFLSLSSICISQLLMCLVGFCRDFYFSDSSE